MLDTMLCSVGAVVYRFLWVIFRLGALGGMKCPLYPLLFLAHKEKSTFSGSSGFVDALPHADFANVVLLSS